LSFLPKIVRLDKAEWDYRDRGTLQELLGIAREAPHAVVDMTGVTYIDSSVIAKLIELYKDRQGRPSFVPVCLVIPSAPVRRILEITGVSEVWPTFETLEEAVSAAGTPSP
jgi:anti-anti-sigma factor